MRLCINQNIFDIAKDGVVKENHHHHDSHREELFILETMNWKKDISTFDDPYAGIRTEQVYIPLSQNPLIDRIRIERTRGTYILYEVDLYRLGEHSVSAQ